MGEQGAYLSGVFLMHFPFAIGRDVKAGHQAVVVLLRVRVGLDASGGDEANLKVFGCEPCQ